MPNIPLKQYWPYVMPGLRRILTLGQIWQLIVNPDPDKNLHKKSQCICRNIFLSLLVINRFKVGVHFGFDLRTPFLHIPGCFGFDLVQIPGRLAQIEKQRRSNEQHQPLDIIFPVNSNIVLRIYNSPTPQKYFSFKVESKKKKRLPRNSSSVQRASKEMVANNSSAGWGLFWSWLFCKKTNDLEIEVKRKKNFRFLRFAFYEEYEYDYEYDPTLPLDEVSYEIKKSG